MNIYPLAQSVAGPCQRWRGDRSSAPTLAHQAKTETYVCSSARERLSGNPDKKTAPAHLSMLKGNGRGGVGLGSDRTMHRSRLIKFTMKTKSEQIRLNGIAFKPMNMGRDNRLLGDYII